jgi:hypothetical protein
MSTETVLKQVRDRFGPLNDQAEQAVAEVVKIMQQMNELPFSPTASEETEEDLFKGENVSLAEYESWSDDRQLQYQTEAEKVNAKWIET